MIVIQIKTIQSDIRLICGYGPQENISEEKRLPFYTTLETEIEKAKNAGLEFLVQMDSNCKLGSEYISGDTHPISSNGKLLSEIIDRQNIKVVNGSNVSSGLFTRYRKVKKSRNVYNIEKSIIDLILTSNKLFNQVTKMEVFESRENVLHRTIKTRNGIHRIESDHNNILTHLKLNVPLPKQERREFYNLKNKECQMKFKNITSNTNMLSSVFNSDESLEIQTKRFVKKLNGCVARSFRKVRYNPKETKKQDNMKILKDELKNGDRSNEEFANIKIWNLRNKLCNKFREPPNAMLDEKGNLLTNEASILEAAQKAHTDRLLPNQMRSNLEQYRVDVNNLCESRLRSTIKNKTKDWELSDLKQALKELNKNKSADSMGYINELFQEDTAGDDLILALLKLINKIKSTLYLPSTQT